MIKYLFIVSIILVPFTQQLTYCPNRKIVIGKSWTFIFTKRVGKPCLPKDLYTKYKKTVTNRKRRRR